LRRCTRVSLGYFNFFSYLFKTIFAVSIYQIFCNNLEIINSPDTQRSFIRTTKIIEIAQARLSTNGYLSLFLRFFRLSRLILFFTPSVKPYTPPLVGVVGPEGGRAPATAISVYLNDRGSFSRRPLLVLTCRSLAPFWVAWHYALAIHT